MQQSCCVMLITRRPAGMSLFCREDVNPERSRFLPDELEEAKVDSNVV